MTVRVLSSAIRSFILIKASKNGTRKIEFFIVDLERYTASDAGGAGMKAAQGERRI